MDEIQTLAHNCRKIVSRMGWTPDYFKYFLKKVYGVESISELSLPLTKDALDRLEGMEKYARYKTGSLSRILEEIKNQNVSVTLSAKDWFLIACNLSYIFELFDLPENMERNLAIFQEAMVIHLKEIHPELKQVLEEAETKEKEFF